MTLYSSMEKKRERKNERKERERTEREEATEGRASNSASPDGDYRFFRDLCSTVRHAPADGSLSRSGRRSKNANTH